MKHILPESERNRLDQLVAEAEKRTRAQIKLAVIRRSDSYAELPWKAFALGTSLAGLVFFIVNILLNYWISTTMVLSAIAAILSAGTAFALVAVFVPAFARLFLSRHRAEMEVQQHARSLFLTHELFATRGRMGILVLVSLFERRVILLPDKGISSSLPEKAMQDIIKTMTHGLRRNEVSKAMEDGLNLLSGILEATAQGSAPAGVENELSNEIIEEKGV